MDGGVLTMINHADVLGFDIWYRGIFIAVGPVAYGVWLVVLHKR